MDVTNYTSYAAKLSNWTFVRGNVESTSVPYASMYGEATNQTSGRYYHVVENRASLNGTIRVTMNAFNLQPPLPIPRPTPFPPRPEYDVPIKGGFHEVFTFQPGFTNVSFTVRKKVLDSKVFSYLMDWRNYNSYANKLSNWTYIRGNIESHYFYPYSDTYGDVTNQTSGSLYLVVESRDYDTLVLVNMNAFTPVPLPPPTPEPIPFPPKEQYNLIIKMKSYEVFTFAVGYSNVSFQVTKKSSDGVVLSFLCDLKNYNAFKGKQPFTYLRGVKESIFGGQYKDGYGSSNNERVSGELYLVVFNDDFKDAAVTIDMDAMNPIVKPVTNDGNSLSKLGTLAFGFLLINFFV